MRFVRVLHRAQDVAVRVGNYADARCSQERDLLPLLNFDANRVEGFQRHHPTNQIRILFDTIGNFLLVNQRRLPKFQFGQADDFLRADARVARHPDVADSQHTPEQERDKENGKRKRHDCFPHPPRAVMALLRFFRVAVCVQYRRMAPHRRFRRGALRRLTQIRGRRS